MERCSGSHPNADVAVLSDPPWLGIVSTRGAGGPSSTRCGHPACGDERRLRRGGPLVLGCTPAEVLARLGDLPGAANRLAVSVGESGVVVLDDTFNSNPAGARFALDRLSSASVAERLDGSSSRREWSSLEENRSKRTIV